MSVCMLFRDVPAFLGNGPPNHLGEWLNAWGDEIAYMRDIRDVARLLTVCKPHGTGERHAWRRMEATVHRSESQLLRELARMAMRQCRQATCQHRFGNGPLPNVLIVCPLFRPSRTLGETDEHLRRCFHDHVVFNGPTAPPAPVDAGSESEASD